ncbi:MAG: hypothetical protein IKC49_03150 [Clostridia bacterium]|nr:hypothetical protein [Clostridia bacterium]
MNQTEERKIKEYLLKKHIKPNYSGYRYLIDAIYLRSKDDYMLRIVKGLYQDVGDIHNTTGSKVERGMRHAIFLAHKKIKESCPTNSEFIAQAVLDLELGRF